MTTATMPAGQERALTLGRWFHVLTAVAAGALLTFGALMSRLAPHNAEGHTPLMGLYERAMLAGWLVWMAALALALMWRHRSVNGSWRLSGSRRNRSPRTSTSSSPGAEELHRVKTAAAARRAG